MKRLSIILSLVLATISASSFARSLEFGISAGVFTTSNYNISGFYSGLPARGGSFSFTASAQALYNIDSVFQAGLSVEAMWRFKGKVRMISPTNGQVNDYEIGFNDREILPLAEVNVKPLRHNKRFSAGAALGMAFGHGDDKLAYGVQAAYVFSAGKHVGVCITAAMRHLAGGYDISDYYTSYKLSYSTFTFPLTVGFRYL